VFADPAADPVDALDKVENAEKLFGSYHQLIQDSQFRFRDFYKPGAGAQGVAGE
jgi:hypothetical protein